jgi:N utilization substance protein A
MSNELLSVLEYMEKEKGISRKDMIESISMAISSAAKKGLNAGQDVRVEIDPKTGSLRAWTLLKVVDFVTNPSQEIHIVKAKQTNPQVALGDIFEQGIDPSLLGRIAAQTARQLIMQRIRRFEKEHVYEQFQDRIGTIITGIVRQQEKGDLYVDFGKAEDILRRQDAIWSDNYGPGERICCLLLDIKTTAHGPELVLSRSHVDFVKCLLSCEVAELTEGIVFIRSIVRDPGYRTKICVDTRDPKVDPVGACVGTRGSRIKNVLKELGQEKVDIIRYSDDIAVLVREAVRPAIPQNLTLDHENHTIHFEVDEKDFASVVGRKGQNARLTSRLLGWKLEVNRILQHSELGFEEKRTRAMQVLNQLPSVTNQIASTLVTIGITSLEAFEGVTETDLIEVGIGETESKAIIQEVKQLLVK